MVSDYSDSETKENKEPKYLVTKFGNRTYKVMVDTGNVLSLVTNRMARETE